MTRLLASLVLLAVVATACASDGSSDAARETATATERATATETTTPSAGETEFGPPPDVPEGDLSPEAARALEDLVGSLEGTLDVDAVVRLGDSGDARVAWFLTDLLRFLSPDSRAADETRVALEKLTDVPGDQPDAYGDMIDHLLAWDLPAHPGYREAKGELFSIVEEQWAPFFAGSDNEVDYRLLQWGGVFIDSRPLGAPDPTTGRSTSGEVAESPLDLCPRGCIPALDDPAVTDAAGGSWYDDADIVFGVVVDGEARAYPRHIMEIHEMVNDTLGDRRIGMPYCTLCGSAQVYLTDSLDDSAAIPVLRTSGLLTRSNKVMYDLNTFSVFDTFTGRALSGSLQGMELEQVSTVVTTWGEWKDAHPETTIVAEDGGVGRVYPLDPLGGRDDDGPIFPVGDVDPRLPVQEPVLGVVTAADTYVAFPVVAATLALEAGEDVSFGEVALQLDGGGLRAVSEDGDDVVSHQAFWFAWSQFHPETELWSP